MTCLQTHTNARTHREATRLSQRKRFGARLLLHSSAAVSTDRKRLKRDCLQNSEEKYVGFPSPCAAWRGGTKSLAIEPARARLWTPGARAAELGQDPNVRRHVFGGPPGPPAAASAEKPLGRRRITCNRAKLQLALAHIPYRRGGVNTQRSKLLRGSKKQN